MEQEYWNRHKARFKEQYLGCPIVLYVDGGQVVELIGSVGENEVEFLVRMESIHPALEEADSCFMETIRKSSKHWNQEQLLINAEIKALNRGSGEPKAPLELARLYAQRKSYDKAYRHFSTAAENGSEQAMVECIRLALVNGHYKLACQWFCKYGFRIDMNQFKGC